MKEDKDMGVKKTPRLNLILDDEDTDMLKRLAATNTDGNMSMFARKALRKIFANPTRFGFEPPAPNQGL